ncbi:HK97 gp10 family phage protein [Arthrobacter sp. MA-N2]|uniref:HK97 gp10 family phage protein n=1 Tax=Arthrobacter sp. MA-N2 TaxID=1101188 RepID=UPI0004B82668|nr:HK97 gp10 family phage protein [Arthrobacter sp. MA-N2]
MGSAGFEALIDDVVARVEEAVPAAAFKAMEHVREVAVSRTPIETGNLRGSAETKPEPNGARVYFPGPYARYQEFELGLRHEQGQALYLTSTIISEEQKVLEIVDEELRKAME